ncbi:SPOR domain-containing protein [Sulfitobacter sp. LCG007]
MHSSHMLGDESGVPQFQSPPKARARSLVLLTNVTGAVVSLGLVAGIGVWSYKLVMRDVTGIPVVRAAAGEMRVRPEDPGGMQARHQGLSVNAVAAEGGAGAPADRIVLAPRTVSLTDDDQPITPQLVASAQQPTRTETSAPAAGTADPAQLAAALDDGNVEAFVAELTKGVEPLDAVVSEEDAAGEALSALDAGEDDVDVVAEIEGAPEGLAEIAGDETASNSTEAAIMAALMGIQKEEQIATPDAARTIPGVRTSIRPRPRPGEAPEMLIQASLSVPQARVAADEIDSSAIPAGTRLAQLGAYESPEIARDEWGKLEARFADFLDGKSRVIEKASSGGRTFYRLRAMGFTDLGDARRFCSALVAENADCIPVVTR